MLKVLAVLLLTGILTGCFDDSSGSDPETNPAEPPSTEAPLPEETTEEEQEATPPEDNAEENEQQQEETPAEKEENLPEDDTSHSPEAPDFQQLDLASLEQMNLGSPRPLLEFSDQNYTQVIRKKVFYEHLFITGYGEIDRIRAELQELEKDQGVFQCNQSGYVHFKVPTADRNSWEMVFDDCAHKMLEGINWEWIVTLDGSFYSKNTTLAEGSSNEALINLSLAYEPDYVSQLPEGLLPEEYTIMYSGSQTCSEKEEDHYMTPCDSENSYQIVLANQEKIRFLEMSSSSTGNQGESNFYVDADALAGAFKVNYSWREYDTDPESWQFSRVHEETHTFTGSKGQAEKLLLMQTTATEDNTYEIQAMNCTEPAEPGVTYQQIVQMDFCN
ncbi:hypothetical protein SAMN05660443_0435 [Marinospirillum celere]|uniref:Uncharacterized protein n=1 Tax=Marinospirillum celere TaxID=1122252 RepID=A0A1I1E8H0_9GAMM|nr:hypothetical protein [Marinospirillum celere]SFB83479.1 hypothetical protein SAMN05660443_0435 [Marinospirillum celere]